MTKFKVLQSFNYMKLMIQMPEICLHTSLLKQDNACFINHSFIYIAPLNETTQECSQPNQDKRGRLE